MELARGAGSHRSQAEILLICLCGIGVATGVFPKDGKLDLKDAGKGGFVTIQTQFSVVLAVILGGKRVS